MSVSMRVNGAASPSLASTGCSSSGARMMLSDHVSVVIYFVVRNDVRFLLNVPSNSDNSFWVPNSRVAVPDSGWLKTAERILHELGCDAPSQRPDTARITRISLPAVHVSQQTISHVTFAVKLMDTEAAQIMIGRNLKWLSINEVMDTWTQFWGLFGGGPPGSSAASNAGVSMAIRSVQDELLHVIQGVVDANGNNPAPVVQELHFSDVLVGLGVDAARLPLVESANLFEFEQEVLHQEFLMRTFPFPKLKRPGYCQFLIEWGWAKDQIQPMFRASDASGFGALSFRDFVVAVAATAPSAQHGGPCGEARCRYIFRYYDANEDGFLEFSEFKSMVTDIHRLKNLSTAVEDVERAAHASFLVFEPENPKVLSLSEFLYGVGQLKFRGTSVLLRAPRPVMDFLQTVYQDVVDVNEKSASDLNFNTVQSGDDVGNNRSRKTRYDNVRVLTPGDELQQGYELAAHSVKVRSGSIINVMTLWEYQGTETLKETGVEHLGLNRIHSTDTFNKTWPPNVMIASLKFFEGNTHSMMFPYGVTCSSETPKQKYTWGSYDRIQLGKNLIYIANTARKLFLHEPRMVQVRSPAYILGDIHGNFHDLTCFEKVFWHLGPTLTPANILFLGDYVDRGNMGVEVVAYLLSHKVAAPEKFFLLRGNHELRSVQKMFQFHDQCFSLFGPTLGPEVWEAINSAFDAMPLAGLIDKKILCLHGGIFPNEYGGGLVDAINTIPVPLSDPEKESPLAWEIMWNDPAHEQALTGNGLMSLKLNAGFAPNVRRGTAHVFSQAALQAFLERNKLSHVIRAHEVQQAGFQLHQKGRLLTVFSSSQYCGYSNEAACVFAENNRLRIIRLDTS
ncbi:unnamed protein product [Notodromas monacha]|uniref:Serine/threonine-protein phosphatase n=1 Tax=Notodromas monacha TaxID=399045 RepID=A0A7R9GGX8_9CRUS|nr:unnamed protein product [Notodromas monacha]CAG0920710.1 unnamed protein product [Notodromas monacha]